MKTFKQIDIWVSVGLIISFSMMIILEPKTDFLDKSNLIMSYFVVGTWQVLSMLIHIFILKSYLIQVRVLYSYTVLGCLIMMPMGLFILGILLYAAPFMALFYTFLCGFELFNLHKIHSYEKA